MKVSMEGRIVIVTGAASGIGKATARQLAASGAKGLMMTDLSEEGCSVTAAELLETGTRVAYIGCDLRNSDAAETIAKATIGAFGRVDALVNAAGLTTRASFETATEKDWHDIFAVNAQSPFFLMKEIIADMKRRSAAGSIVNVLSINTHCGAPDLSVYSASKAALLTLTKNAANSFLHAGIRVNGLNLGWTLTEGEDRMQSEILGLGPSWAESAARDLPLGRLLTPEEAARHILFMLSDASAPMTGLVHDLEQRVIGA